MVLSFGEVDQGVTIFFDAAPCNFHFFSKVWIEGGDFVSVGGFGQINIVTVVNIQVSGDFFGNNDAEGVTAFFDVE